MIQTNEKAIYSLSYYSGIVWYLYFFTHVMLLFATRREAKHLPIHLYHSAFITDITII